MINQLLPRDIDFMDNKNLFKYIKTPCGQAKYICLLYTSPSPRDATLSRMPSSA